MAAQNLTEYERRRLENIKRNEEMLSSLKIPSKVEQISTSLKRERPQRKSEKKAKIDESTVIRRSLRIRGQPPDSSTDKDHLQHEALCESRKTFSGLAVRIFAASTKLEVSPRVLSSTLDVDSLELKSKNIARVILNRILCVKFLPSMNMKMVVVGNIFGNVCFWDIDSKREPEIYEFHPHSAPVSGIVVQSFAQTKVFTSCYNGFVRLMDVEKEASDLLYSSNKAIYCLGQQPNDQKSLYFGEGSGIVNVWDNNAGKSSNSWALHVSNINTIDFNPANVNLMVTSSSDYTACIWDLRKMNKHKPHCLQKISHQGTINSAYFSPSGSSLVTTSLDDNIGLVTGATFEDITMIRHNNRTGRWISPLRAIWGWDDSTIFVGNMNKGVDVISTERKRIDGTLQSPHLTAVTSPFDIHPYHVGVLAGGTSRGDVYVWTP